MAFVIDASATLPWCFRDEETPLTLATQQRAATGEVLLVPSHWAVEVLNSILQANRRSRISSEDIERFLADLATFRIEVDSRPLMQHLVEVRALAERYRLSTYDAAYLELAKRRNLSFATFDKELIQAAVAEGVPLIH